VPTFRATPLPPESRAPQPVAAAPVQASQPEPQPVAPAQPILRDDVVLTPTQPRTTTAFEAHPEVEAALEEAQLPPDSYIPPAAERPIRAARMPRVEELPLPAQNEIRAMRSEADMSQDPKRMTLLQRLATVGFGKREEGAPVSPAHDPRVQRVAEPRPPSAVHAEYAKRPAAPQGYRPAQGQLDPHGRPAPAPRPAEDDQLEIPAFLRRQAN
jgi:cell division protein FtsZ